jgi:hypothetical protein
MPEDTKVVSIASSQEELDRNEHVYAKIESIDSLGTSLEKLRVYGWAYKEESSQDENRSVNVILKNFNNEYTAESTIAIRPDIFEKEVAKNRQLPAKSLGFEARFSTINVKNGIYNVWLRVEEANGDYGYTNTKVQIYKDGATVCDLSDINLKPIKNTVDGDMQVEFDTLKLIDNSLSVNGWYILKNVEYGNVTTYIEISDGKGKTVTHTFGTLKIKERMDIVNAFKQPQYQYSGFFNTIELPKNFDTSSLKIRIIMDNDDVYYSSKPEMYLAHDENDVEGEIENSTIKIYQRENSEVKKEN